MNEYSTLINTLSFLQGVIEEMREKEIEILKVLAEDNEIYASELRAKKKYFNEQYGFGDEEEDEDEQLETNND